MLKYVKYIKKGKTLSIHKIEKLTSIGKFRNYLATGTVNFEKLTLIYGNNGSGKTTLTSIFRSLANNKPEIVRSRLSTNHTEPQTVQIIENGNPRSTHTLRESGWSTPLENIEIFDIHFVNDNIYSGFDFNDEHKKQLHQFVIGAQGVALQEQIEENKRNKKTTKEAIKSIEDQLIQQVGNNLQANSLRTFLTIHEDQSNGIDQLITTAENTLSSANSNSIIQTLQPLNSIGAINSGINFTTLSTDLQANIEAIQDETLKALFSSHSKELSDNTIQASEPWLKTGFNYIINKEPNIQNWNSDILSCPFCKQGVDTNIDIIKAYTLQFNEEFNLLVEKIQIHLNTLQAFNLETTIQTLNNINQNNTSHIATWSRHLPEEIAIPLFNIIADEVILKEELQTLITTVQQKLQNPSIAITFDTHFKTSLQTIYTNILNYNTTVTAYNNQITTFLSTIPTVTQAQQDLENLIRIKKRFETSIVNLCDQLAIEKASLRTLNTAYTILVEQQEREASVFFDNYKTRINYYLENVFRTHFRINDVEHVPPRGQATQSKIGYKLTYDNQDISFNSNHSLSVKETLSEGDKTTIALAFFLSKLDIDPDRSNKILVFDDPLSSLDTNRRTYTVGIIKELLNQMEQVIVLSHNEYFLHEIGNNIHVSNKKTLQITENFLAKASTINVCDLNDLVKNDYFKHIEALESFLTNPDLLIKDTVFGWLRNVLESHLRFKFYKEIRNMRGQSTFGKLVDYIESSSIVFSDNSNRNEIITKLRLINSVSWMPHHGTPAPSFTTLGINPHSITATELQYLIQDTLDLVENKL